MKTVKCRACGEEIDRLIQIRETTTDVLVEKAYEEYNDRTIDEYYTCPNCKERYELCEIDLDDNGDLKLDADDSHEASE